MPYTFLLMGILLLVLGSIELQTQQKTSAVVSIVAAAFVFFIGFYIL